MAADWRSSEVSSELAQQELPDEAAELAPRQQAPALVPALRLTGPPAEQELPVWEALAQCPS